MTLTYGNLRTGTKGSKDAPTYRGGHYLSLRRLLKALAPLYFRQGYLTLHPLPHSLLHLHLALPERLTPHASRLTLWTPPEDSSLATLLLEGAGSSKSCLDC